MTAGTLLGSAPARSYFLSLGRPHHAPTTYILKETRGTTLVVAPVRASLELPSAGERVSCVSVAGWWTAVVVSSDDGVVVLDQPAWMRRPAQRFHRRVPLVVPVGVRVPGEDRSWPSQLVDLSLGGAAVLVESTLPDRAALRVECDLPQGRAQGVARSRRVHAHPGLVVVGVQWAGLDAKAQAWVNRQVAEGLTFPQV